uniref:BHLH domain-containing protein n=1 Tax=Sinocyclocheilus anshuiensis TaxID=1608454 RepID=A0A671M500_9TELE
MTPTIISKEQLPLNNKLRKKPRVEKMRRDRINSSIEQLKCLLAPEFLKQQPDTKLEKADILEMTLNFFRINRRESVLSHAVNQGFSRCVREIVHFLSKDEMKTESQRRLLKHFQKLQTSCEQNRRESVLPDQNTFSKEMNVNKSSIWRPWWSLTATSSTC